MKIISLVASVALMGCAAPHYMRQPFYVCEWMPTDSGYMTEIHYVKLTPQQAEDLRDEAARGEIGPITGPYPPVK